MERKLEELRRFNATLEASSVDDVEKNITFDKLRLKKDMMQLVTNQIYDKRTKLFNDTRRRLGIKGGASIEEPVRNYDNFHLDDNGNLTFTYKNKVINFGNIKEGLIPPSRIRELGVNTVQAICNITNISCKNHTNSHEFVQINFVNKFVYEILEKFFHEFAHKLAHEFIHEREFVHEFMPKYYIFKERI